MYRVKFTYNDCGVRYLVTETDDGAHILSDGSDNDDIMLFNTIYYAINAAVSHAVRWRRHHNAKDLDFRGGWEIERLDDTPRWLSIDPSRQG